MIALAILGVIAALTLPGVFANVNQAGNEAKLKSHITAIHQAFNADVLDGTYVSIAKTLTTRLNYANHCPPNNVDGPCAKAWWAPAGGPLGGEGTYVHRFIMPDGSIIWDHGHGRVHIKVVNDKDASIATDGTGNALLFRYNHTMATFPADYGYPDVPPGELKPFIVATDLYKKVFE
jgi:type II secretory pathway pseudopilin PulG